jgi:hypothetical protein
VVLDIIHWIFLVCIATDHDRSYVTLALHTKLSLNRDFRGGQCYQENFYTSLRTCRCLLVDDRSLSLGVNGRLIRRESNGRLL